MRIPRRPVVLSVSLLVVAGTAVGAIAWPAGTVRPPELPLAEILSGPASVYLTHVASAPTDPNSAAMVRDLNSVITDRYGGVAAFNAHDYATSVYTVGPRTRRVTLQFSNCQHKSSVPTGLYGHGGQFVNVPIPVDAQTALGTDNALSIYEPGTDQLWEFWEVANISSPTPSACWGGRLDHLSTAYGYFGNSFGATATDLSDTAGSVGLAQARSGVIGHALNLAIPDSYGAGHISWPAQGTDGDTGVDGDTNAIPEGSRLRLDPSIDVATLPGLTPLAREVAEAAQTYGFIVTDTSGAVSVIGESGRQDQTNTGVDPWNALEQGVPDYAILKNFPWTDLQVVAQSWQRPANPTATNVH